MKQFGFNLTLAGNTGNVDATSSLSDWLPIVLSIVVAAVISVYPLGSVLANMRPMFLFVVTVFWVLHKPWLVGIWFAFFTGLLGDLLLDTQLGQQAMSSVISVFALQLLIANTKRLADLQAWLFASASIVLNSLLLLLLQLSDGQVILWRSGLPMLTGVLIWPVVVILLKRH